MRTMERVGQVFLEEGTACAKAQKQKGVNVFEGQREGREKIIQNTAHGNELEFTLQAVSEKH